MNIRAISILQKGDYNPATKKFEGFNCFKEYVQFCMQRRSYQQGRKGLTLLGRDLRRQSEKKRKRGKA